MRHRVLMFPLFTFCIDLREIYRLRSFGISGNLISPSERCYFCELDFEWLLMNLHVSVEYNI